MIKEEFIPISLNLLKTLKYNKNIDISYIEDKEWIEIIDSSYFRYYELDEFNNLNICRKL